VRRIISHSLAKVTGIFSSSHVPVDDADVSRGASVSAGRDSSYCLLVQEDLVTVLNAGAEPSSWF
jgi:hypothetical protein